MFLTNLFNFKKTCQHDKITPDMDFGYCPDCGKLIKNEWYITRCACCGVKLRTIINGKDVVPQNHYCTNCGQSEYTVEQLEKINFIDINFAVLKRNVVEENLNKTTSTQCWQGKTIELPKLPVKYL